MASEARAARAALRTRADWPAADIAHALATDPASPDSPVLTGAPLDFRQPVSVLFSTPVPFVGVRAGYPDAAGQWTVTAYDAVGTSLGSVVSSTVGSRISAFSTRTAPRSPG